MTVTMDSNMDKITFNRNGVYNTATLVNCINKLIDIVNGSEKRITELETKLSNLEFKTMVNHPDKLRPDPIGYL